MPLPYPAKHMVVPLTYATTHIRNTGCSSTWCGAPYASLLSWPCADGRGAAVACGSAGRLVLAVHCVLKWRYHHSCAPCP